jgi:PAS domain S-box-containing protein
MSEAERPAGPLPDAATLSALIEHVPVTVYIDRLDDVSSNVFMSAQLEAVLGYSAEEWASDAEFYLKVIHPDDLERVLTEHRRTRETGDMFSMEYRMVARDGSIRWFLDEARVIRDAAGQPVSHHGFLLDITERKELEYALHREKQHLQSLLENSLTAIIAVDLHDTITAWNPAAEKLFGYTREEAIGRNIDELVANSVEVRIEAEKLNEQAREEGYVHVVTRRTRRDGALVDVEVLVAPVVLGGEVQGFYAIYHDIGELMRARRAAEEATQTIRAQADELAEWNHTLNARVDEQVEEIERIGRLRRFLTPQVADAILATGADSVLESHRSEITAVFCDLRGFTHFAEVNEPEDVMRVLREYHGAMGEIISEYGATLEHFEGDGMMLFFNDPIPVADPTNRAVRMAIAMRDRAAELTDAWLRHGYELGFGVGVARGYATLGRIGFEGRFDYGAVGPVVNMASRLGNAAASGQILISMRVFAEVEDVIDAEPVGEFEMKGFHGPQKVFNVMGVKAQGVRAEPVERDSGAAAV